MTEQAKDKILLSRLGFYLDGWADMVEGMGGKATDVRKDLITELKNRKMPEVEVEAVDAQPVVLSSDTRPYSITTTSPGATTTIYVGQHGHDLYTSWRVFLKPILNKEIEDRFESRLITLKQPTYRRNALSSLPIDLFFYTGIISHAAE